MWVAFRQIYDETFFPGQICEAFPLYEDKQLYYLCVGKRKEVFSERNFEVIGDTIAEREAYLLEQRESIAEIIDNSKVIVIRNRNGKPYTWVNFTKDGMEDYVGFFRDEPNYYVQNTIPFVIDYAKSVKKKIIYVDFELRPGSQTVYEFHIINGREKTTLICNKTNFIKAIQDTF